MALIPSWRFNWWLIIFANCCRSRPMICLILRACCDKCLTPLSDSSWWCSEQKEPIVALFVFAIGTPFNRRLLTTEFKSLKNTKDTSVNILDASLKSVTVWDVRTQKEPPSLAPPKIHGLLWSLMTWHAARSIRCRGARMTLLINLITLWV